MQLVPGKCIGRNLTWRRDHSVMRTPVRLAALRHRHGALRQEKQAADAANRAKSAFLANMTHEIRTPINVVLGTLKLTMQTNLSAEQREYLSLMQTASTALASLINDILDFSRLEAGHFEIEHIPFSLREVIGDTLRMLALEAQLKGLQLEARISPDIPETLLGDANRLRQVVVNLVGNAIKFTEQGKIVVRVVPTPDCTKDEFRCHFSVSDSGIGIPAEKQSVVFQPYRQAEAATARRHGGTGLGLSIAAHLVELMKGKIWVNSIPGQGSIFHFTVCCGQPPQEHKNTHIIDHPDDKARGSHKPPGTPKARTILLVEDNPMNRRLTQMVLEKEGHRVLMAESGKAALTILDQEACDLVLMDLQMEEMDGLQTAAAIRRQKGSKLPIIALTAHARPGDRERCMQAGMNACLTKPLQPDHLHAVLDGLHSTLPAVRPAGSDVVLDRRHLFRLVHGDTNLLREICGIFLRDHGRLMDNLRGAVDERDSARAASAAHTLNGMFQSLGARAASHVARQLESNCLDAAWEPSCQLCEQLACEVEVLKATLADLANQSRLAPRPPDAGRPMLLQPASRDTLLGNPA